MVAAPPPSLRLIGDEDNAKRRQILAGASKVFMDLGFDGASMGEIARAAGVSKGTLYVYFADKSRLFEAIVQEETLEQGRMAFNFDPERDVGTTLREFGQAYIELLCRPGGGSAIRTVMAIAERMPDVGRRYYENHQPPRRLSAGACDGKGAGDRRLPAGGVAIHADVPGVAVSAVHLSGRTVTFGGAHRGSGGKCDADVPRRVSGQAGLAVGRTASLPLAYVRLTPYSSSSSSSLPLSTVLCGCGIALAPPSDPVTTGSRDA
jgi:AcrR family transcriptional regulator